VIAAEAERGLPEAETALPDELSGPSRFARGLDFVCDWGVLVFAAWTLIAYAGMATDAQVSVLVALWLATVPLLGALLFVLARRRVDGSPPRTGDDAPRLGGLARGRRPYLLAAGLAVGLVFAILAAAAPDAPWPLLWLGACIAVAIAVALGRLSSEGASGTGPTLGWSAHAFAALVGLGFAVMSLFISRPDEDDAFYINRATATAGLNRIPVLDVLFTDERLDPVRGTGLPVDSFAALQGALGRLVDVHAASVAYYVTPPILTFFATWALWRLLRSWAPRRVVLCFALGCVYWVFSAQSGLTAGSFFLARMWQGKVVFAAFLVLTVYVYLTRWLEKRDAATGLLLLAAGLAGLGLTASATFVAPLIVGAAAIPLVARRDWRGLPVLAAAGAIPLVLGLVVSLNYPLTEPNVVVEEAFTLDTSWFFHEVLGDGVVVLIGAVALVIAPWLARSGPPARLVTGIAVVSVLLLAPAVLPTLNDVTDLTRLLRRTLWVIPLPAFVGLLAAFPVMKVLGRFEGGVSARARRLAVAAPAVLVAALLVAFGNPLWVSIRNGESLWVSQPTWKTDQEALADARAILARYRGNGPVLAEERVMLAIALSVVRPKAVNPRTLYARFLPESVQRTNDRLALTRFVGGREPMSSREVRRALANLRVGLVCAEGSRPRVIVEVEATGDYREAFRVPGLVCLTRQQAAQPASSR
jgi:MFS family permease